LKKLVSEWKTWMPEDNYKKVKKALEEATQ